MAVVVHLPMQLSFPHPVLAESEAGREGMPLNDMEFSITQPDDTNCKQFSNAVGRGPSTPSNTDEVLFGGECFEQNQPDDVSCKQFGNAVGRGPSMPNSADDEANFSSERFEQCTGLPVEEENPYIEPVSSELPPGGIQPDDCLLYTSDAADE